MFRKSSKKPPKTILPTAANIDLPLKNPENSDNETGELSLDVFQTKDEIFIVAPVAGVKKNDLKISIDDDVLNIQGKREFSFQVQREDYVHQECYWGNFSRSVVLPENVDIRHAKSSLRDGILTVRIPKTERIKNKTLEIKEE